MFQMRISVWIGRQLRSTLFLDIQQRIVIIPYRCFAKTDLSRNVGKGNYHYILRNIPEECGSHLHHGSCLKSRMALSFLSKYRIVKSITRTENGPLFLTEGGKGYFVIKAGQAVQGVESNITAFILLTAVRTSNCFAGYQPYVAVGKCMEVFLTYTHVSLQ